MTASRWRAVTFPRVRDRAGFGGEARNEGHGKRRSLRGWTVLLALAHATAVLAAPTSLSLSAGVVDEAGILTADPIAAIAVKLKTLEDRTADHFVVVTVKSLQGENIDDYTHQLRSAWAIGDTKLNNVVILLVAPNERKVRIDVGSSLEGSLTDALSQAIIDTAILPRLRANDMAGAIDRGVDAIIRVLDGDEQAAPTPR